MSGEAPITPQDRARGLKRTVAVSAGVVLAMGALSFASVPLYDLFCRVTGYAGTTQTAADRGGPPREVLDEKISIWFDATVNPDLPWRFEPVQREMSIRIGEEAMAFYRATNLSNEPVTGRAVYNVAPHSVGEYFVKIECFCFTEQTLQPGQSVDMPVSFYVDPEIRRDRTTKHIPGVTLSYTFYRHDTPQQAAALTTGAAGARTAAEGAATP